MAKKDVSLEVIAETIKLIRGQKVMLDRDLAELYGVETKTLVQAVKRNSDRFPDDFMFQLSTEELEYWRSQIVTSNPSAKMSLRRKPYAFTEQGVAMLSSVLRSKQAVLVNVQIMRVFVKMRQMLGAHKDLAQRIKRVEKKIGQHDEEIGAVFKVIKELIDGPSKKKGRTIGF